MNAPVKLSINGQELDYVRSTLSYRRGAGHRTTYTLVAGDGATTVVVYEDDEPRTHNVKFSIRPTKDAVDFLGSLAGAQDITIELTHDLTDMRETFERMALVTDTDIAWVEDRDYGVGFEQFSLTRTATDPKLAQPKSPQVITICGSSRFIDIMAVCSWHLERDEQAITMGLHMLPLWYSDDLPAHHLAEHEGVADQMDELHLRKIDLSDAIFVVDADGGYIGESTRREIEYAQSTGKAVRYFSSDHVGKDVRQLIESAAA